jgi:hypothetical protein
MQGAGDLKAEQRESLLVMARAAVAVALLLALAFPGCTGDDPLAMRETAQVLVNNRKFGGEAQQRAIGYGDDILPLIREESKDFALLDNRNSFWIAEVLGAIRTDASRAIMLDLYSRGEPMARLTGAIALAQQGALPDPVEEGGFLIRTVREGADDDLRELAIIALGRSRDPAALPCLLDVLRVPHAYGEHARACVAVARIGSHTASPVLRDCLRSPDFHALPDAFRALLALGDREAVPLAIARISPALKGYNSGGVVEELETVTGVSHGYDRPAWSDWWESVEATWQIPQPFLRPWDEQASVQ